jgi:hypothetical protein
MARTDEASAKPNCRAALKTENVGNGVGLLHLNRIFRTFGAGVTLLLKHSKAALALLAARNLPAHTFAA